MQEHDILILNLINKISHKVLHTVIEKYIALSPY